MEGIYRGAFHLLATDLEADTTGSVSMSAPNAYSHNTRLIPVLQSDFQVSQKGLLKNSLFYDWAYLSYQNPDTGFGFASQTKQWGTENVYLTGPWKVGASFRSVSYYTDTFTTPEQAIGNFQLSLD